MAYLSKQFINQYGHTDNCLIVDISENLTQHDDGSYTCNLRLLGYKDIQAYLDGKTLTDCFRPVLSYTVTLEEKENAPGQLDKDKLGYCFAQKAIESILGEGNETNVFTGNIGQITFQDSTVN